MDFKLAVTRWIPDKIYLQMLFYKHFRHFIDFKNPKTYNEKLQWLKLHDRNPDYTRMVDKYEAKKYVANLIGEEFIIPTLGVWKTPEEIEFDTLPNQFVLKWNHDSGSIVICKDKKTFDKEAAIKKLQKGKVFSGYWYGREWPYKDVKPCIIAEQYLKNTCSAVESLQLQKDNSLEESLIDYKFYCFNGKAEFLYVSRGLGMAHEQAEISFFDLNWNEMEFKRGDFKPLSVAVKKPQEFNKMIELANKLSAGHAFLRVDFYEIDGRVYFSELTFYPCSGLMQFEPKEWDYKIGESLKLPIQK